MADFLLTLQELDVDINSLTLAWRSPRPGSKSGHVEERPEDQQRNLSERLRKIGFGTAVVHLKPRMSQLSHFHDRVVTAIFDADDSGVTSFRRDITSGIDNLMERDRQCSVFLTKKAISSPIATSEGREKTIVPSRARPG
jgi:hypothetical protein